MTEHETRSILENHREVGEDTGEKSGHKIIRCLGSAGNGYIFECKSTGYLNLKTMPFIESPDAAYEVAVYSDGTVVCIPQ